MADSANDDPYDLALRDSGFQAAATAAHTGRWHLLDALWWEWHPEEPAPSGTRSPIQRLRELQRRVFAADGDAAGDHSVAQIMRELEVEITAERAAITVAIAAARAHLEHRTTGRPALEEAAPGDPAVHAAANAEDAAGIAAVGPEPDTTRRRWALLAASLTAAVLVGAVGGSQLHAASLPGAAPAASAEASATATPLPLALSIFQRAPMPEDVPAVSLPGEFDASTVRALGSMGSDVAGPDWTSYYYAARTTSNLVCLIVVPPQPTTLSTCIQENDFPSTGLRLYWQSEGVFVDTGTATGPIDSMLLWRPDGTVEVGTER